MDVMADLACEIAYGESTLVQEVEGSGTGRSSPFWLECVHASILVAKVDQAHTANSTPVCGSAPVNTCLSVIRDKSHPHSIDQFQAIAILAVNLICVGMPCHEFEYGVSSAKVSKAIAKSGTNARAKPLVGD